MASNMIQMEDRSQTVQNTEKNLKQIEEMLPRLSENKSTNDIIKQDTTMLRDVINNRNTPMNSLTDISGAILIAREALEYMNKDDLDSMPGILRVMKAFARPSQPLFESWSEVSSECASIFNKLFSLFLPSWQRIDDVLQKVIKRNLQDVLTETQIRDVLAKASGARKLFVTSKNYLDGFAQRREPITLEEMGSMETHVPISTNAKFLGFLEAKVQEYYENAGSHTGKEALMYARVCIAFAHIYAQLSLLQGSILLQTITLLKSRNDTGRQIDGIVRVGEGCLTSLKDTLAVLNQDRQMVVLMHHLTNPDAITNQMIELAEIELPPFSLNLSDDPNGKLVCFADPRKKWVGLCLTNYLCCGGLSDKAQFRLRKAGDYWTMESHHWPGWYLSLPRRHNESKCLLKSTTIKDSELVQFVIVEKGQAGAFIISPKLRMDLFWGIENNNLRCLDVPTPFTMMAAHPDI